MTKFPSGMYSCVSGFVDACESVQDAVRREVWEESGVVVGDVELFDSQPWPIARSGCCELMIGCIAYAKSENIRISKAEIEIVQDMRWFTADEVSKLLLDEKASQFPFPVSPSRITDAKDLSKIYIPGSYAIAHHLLREFVGRFRHLQTLRRFEEEDEFNIVGASIMLPPPSRTKSEASVRSDSSGSVSVSVNYQLLGFSIGLVITTAFISSLATLRFIAGKNR
jgi:8-oxo-dGTP pyrophosphatase MutT (NUDIX family)